MWKIWSKEEELKWGFLLKVFPRPGCFCRRSRRMNCPLTTLLARTKLNFPILPSINLIWYKSRSLIQFYWIYCLFVYKDQDAEVIPKNKWIKCRDLRMTNILERSGNNKNVLLRRYSGSRQAPVSGSPVTQAWIQCVSCCVSHQTFYTLYVSHFRVCCLTKKQPLLLLGLESKIINYN